ncbi:4-oxalocrotonate tautomerase family protein [Intrasporangium sp.]|uniref:tautomerase family protein n=1 Tax=Intrasporangium sp. TaxID=1925024 RepID=UPI00293B864E|nr:4-oxalocrotonate tautomerase family protein [Intrasporangium sp.]MDV3222214.1 4-oxalocrotonate tautomerase family protein [Intrasporangium sp.]
MPFVNVKVIENVFTEDQKQEILTRVTDALVAVEGEAMRGVTWVVIDEVKSGDWAIGGQALSTRAVHELAGVAVG